MNFLQQFDNLWPMFFVSLQILTNTRSLSMQSDWNLKIRQQAFIQENASRIQPVP